MVSAITSATTPLIPLIPAEPSAALSRGGLPASLAERYGSDLSIPIRLDRPTVVANFVSTLDGVVSYNVPDAAGGGEISGFFEPDRFVMGLLRSLADVVLIGAGTLRAAPRHRWIPAHVHRASAPAFAELRTRLGLRDQPLTALVTASGDVDLDHPGLSDPGIPVLIVTSQGGADALARQSVPAHVEIASLGADEVEASSIVDLLARRGARLVLSEGGPHLLGQLLSADLVDELFLTSAPQIAGRSREQSRLALVEGVAYDIAHAPWFNLVDLRRSGDHLFSRYRTRGDRA
jgi:riboflavin biosynthesis pyrimidine reductase